LSGLPRLFKFILASSKLWSGLEKFKKRGYVWIFFYVKNRRVITVGQFRKYSFTSGTLATLPLPPSLQT